MSAAHQRGSAVADIVIWAISVYVAFLVGCNVMNKKDVSLYNTFVDGICNSNGDKKAIKTSTKVYRCEYARDLTPDEATAYKKFLDELWMPEWMQDKEEKK